MTPQEIYQSIRPAQGLRIYDLVRETGLDVRFWEVSNATGLPIDPYDNTYRNSQWTFGGGDQPLVACIWWNDMTPLDDRLVRIGNARRYAEQMEQEKVEAKGDASKSQSLATKIPKARAFDRLMSEARLRRKPVRVVVLEGERADADKSEVTRASKRLLDPVPWFVHEYDDSGRFLLVREIPMPAIVPADPFDGAKDPGEDSAFQAMLDAAPLSDTEKAALIKVRVGQGFFREKLLQRWGGCAVTQCKKDALLVASHIKPWSLCTARAERLSPDNGILLTPNLDKAFDRGLISFDNAFRIILHPALDLHTRNTLPIDPAWRLRQRHEGMKPFLKWHRQHFGFEPMEDEACPQLTDSSPRLLEAAAP